MHDARNRTFYQIKSGTILEKFGHHFIDFGRM